MISFLRVMFGLVCCPRDDGKPEWTPWEKKSADFSRPLTYSDDIMWPSVVEIIEYTKIWQERQCATCGKIQQKSLKY